MATIWVIVVMHITICLIGVNLRNLRTTAVFRFNNVLFILLIVRSYVVNLACIALCDHDNIFENDEMRYAN